MNEHNHGLRTGLQGRHGMSPTRLAEIRKRAIRDLTLRARTEPGFLPPQLVAELRARGVDVTRAILTKLETRFPCCPNLFVGQWLTPEHRFIEFEVDAARDGMVVHRWDDVTHATSVSEHERGTRFSWGHLCTQVQSELGAGAAEQEDEADRT